MENLDMVVFYFFIELFEFILYLYNEHLTQLSDVLIHLYISQIVKDKLVDIIETSNEMYLRPTVVLHQRPS